MLTVWVTAGEGDLIGQIAAQVARATASWRPGARRRLGGHLEALTLRAGVPSIAGVEATIRSRPDVPATTGSRAFEEVVRAAAEGDRHRGLIVLIDEIQAADPDGLRTLAYTWQHLQSEGEDVPAAVYAAGLPNAADAISSAVTFSERFAYRPLPPLQPADEELALAIPARQLGVDWDRDAVSLAVSIARGYPYLVQLIGDAAWAAAGRPDPGALITVADVQIGKRTVDADLDALFQARWANSSAREREFMAAMAQEGDGPIMRRTIADRLGVTSQSLSVVRARLIDKGQIQATLHGAVEFTVPGFSQFVRRRADE